MVSQVIIPARADVIIREDVIESSADPKPNAFYDSRMGVLWVYHGPVYGNPTATIVPPNINQIGSYASQPYALPSAGACCNYSQVNECLKARPSRRESSFVNNGPHLSHNHCPQVPKSGERKNA